MSTDPTTPAGTNPATTLPEAWLTHITPFAAAIGKTVPEVSAALETIVGPPSSEAVVLLRSADDTPFEDIKAALPGVPVARLRRGISEHLRAGSTPTTPTASAP